LLGIQSQLWTETVRNESIFDALFMPNLIVFAERAWAPRPEWLNLKGNAQIDAMHQAWNAFSNTLGQRQLPLIDQRLSPWAYDLPKAGGIIKENTLYLKQAFPGMELRYTLDGSVPTAQAIHYQKPIPIKANATVKVRVFNALGRGGKTIEVN
jgi:hexosaminidase